MRDGSSPDATTTGVASQPRTLLDSMSMPSKPANQNLRQKSQGQRRLGAGWTATHITAIEMCCTSLTE